MFLPCILFELEFFFFFIYISLTILFYFRETPPEIRKNKIYIWCNGNKKKKNIRIFFFFGKILRDLN